LRGRYFTALLSVVKGFLRAISKLLFSLFGARFAALFAQPVRLFIFSSGTRFYTALRELSRV
jgi:hypothetical protein